MPFPLTPIDLTQSPGPSPEQPVNVQDLQGQELDLANFRVMKAILRELRALRIMMATVHGQASFVETQDLQENF